MSHCEVKKYLKEFRTGNKSSAQYFLANIHLNTKKKLGRVQRYFFHQNLYKKRPSKFIEKKTVQNCVGTKRIPV